MGRASRRSSVASDEVENQHVVAYIEWVDSALDMTGWSDQKEVLDRLDFGKLIQSAGLVIRRDSGGVVLAVGFHPLTGEEPDISGVLAIPRECIRTIKLWDPSKTKNDK